MSKTFYTNVRRVGNSILVRGYENGMPVDKEIKYRPHLFLPAQGKETEYKVFKSNFPVVKKTFDTIKDFQEYAESYADVSNFKIYGCSDVQRQFLNDYYVGEIDWSYELTKVWYFDIETKAERRKYELNHIVETRKGNEPLRDINMNDDVFDEEKKTWVTRAESCYEQTIGGFQTAAKAEAEMLLITMFEKTEQVMHIWSMRPISDDNPIYSKFKKCDVRVFSSEDRFLSDFCLFMRTTRIDVLTGWNSESFDIPYIVNRIQNLLGESFMKLISPWKIIKPRTVKPDNFDPYTTYDIGGITHLDALDLYKKFNPGSQESFTLDHIAFVELGERKVEIPVDTFRDSYSPEHWETFVLYCCVDTHLVYKIDTKMQHTMLAMQLAFLAKCAFADVISAMRLWESIIYGHFIEQNIVEDFVKPRNEKASIVGAFVLEPVPGKYGHTFSIDAAQLYPSMMMQHNISPETMLRMIDGVSIESILRGEIPDDFDPETECLSANGLVTTKKIRGFIPELVDMMGNLRKTTKKKMLALNQEIEDMKVQMAKTEDSSLQEKISSMEAISKGLDVKQKGLKVASNSLYGALGLVYFRYYDPKLAEAITSNGQVMLKTCMQIINKMMNMLAKTENKNYVLAADTDSNYVLIEPILDTLLKKKNLDRTMPNIVDVVEEFVQKGVQPTIDRGFVTLLSKIGFYQKEILFKLENIGTILITGKKRNCFDVMYSEGVRYKEPKIKVTGLEIVRSSTPKVCKEYLKESVRICMRGTETELQSYVGTVKVNFMKHDYQEIAFPRGCNGLSTYASNSSIYQKGTPMHVRGALLHNHHLKRLELTDKYNVINEGEKIKYIALRMPNPIRENVFSFIGKIPEELGIVRYIDKETQYKKAFLDPLQGILDVIGWEPEHRLTFD